MTLAFARTSDRASPGNRSTMAGVLTRRMPTTGRFSTFCANAGMAGAYPECEGGGDVSHSMTSSARARIEGGTVRPSDLAS
jgi:hypothetical protein